MIISAATGSLFNFTARVSTDTAFILNSCVLASTVWAVLAQGFHRLLAPHTVTLHIVRKSRRKYVGTLIGNVGACLVMLVKNLYSNM